MTLSRTILRPLLAAGLLAAIAVSGSARAEEEFDVTVSSGKVVVKTKGDWHINLEYPWKAKVNGEKLEKDKFTLSQKEAVVATPKGKVELKGGVCSGEQCRMFQKTLDVP